MDAGRPRARQQRHDEPDAGPQALLIYNDAYAAGIGRRHPRALGASAFEAFLDAAAVFAPLFERALAGECVSLRDLQFRFAPGEMPRDEAWCDLTYSPVRDERGEVAGALVIVVDTTERVLTEREHAAARQVKRVSETREALLLALSDVLQPAEEQPVQEVARGRLADALP